MKATTQNSMSKLAKSAAFWLALAGGLVALVIPLTFAASSGPHATLQLRLLLFALATGSLVIAASIALQGQIHLQSLLRTEERLQYKDAVTIATAFLLLLVVGLYVVSASAEAAFGAPARSVFVVVSVALASCAVGGAFGFLFGLPHMDATNVADAHAKSFLGMRIRTGLDDIVDWLVKGITTVLLVNTWPVFQKLKVVASWIAQGLDNAAKPPQVPSAIAFIFSAAVLAFFLIIGAVGVYLVTRTYLTGALGRADRATIGAFGNAGLSVNEVLTLLSDHRDVTERGRELNPESKRISEKLAQLSLADLESPQEFALWAKAKSALGHPDDAISGYAKAVSLCDCSPALHLEFAVALSLKSDGAADDVYAELKKAHSYLSSRTDQEVRKNIYKSLTYVPLYHPKPIGFEEAIRYAEEYFRFKDEHPEEVCPSAGILVNYASAQGQRAAWITQQAGGASLSAEEQQAFDDARSKALQAARQALAMDPTLSVNLDRLLRHDHPDKLKDPATFKNEDDLEIFEKDPEFRALLGLPAVAAPTRPTPAVATPAVAAPITPTDVKLAQTAPDAVTASWSAVVGAEKYRPFKKLEGADNDFVALDLTSETAALLKNLPAKATVHFQVTAYNGAGESGKSEVVTVTLS